MSQRTSLTTGNSLVVLAVDANPDGDCLVVCQRGDDQSRLALGLWSIPSMALITPVIRQEDAMPMAARFAADGEHLVFADELGRATLLNLQSGSRVVMGSALDTKWVSAARKRNRVALSSSALEVWDIDPLSKVFTLPAPVPPVATRFGPRCALSANGELLAATGIESGCIVLYDVKSGAVTQRLSTPDEVRSIDLDERGSQLAVVSQYGGAQVWNTTTGTPLVPDVINLDADYYRCVAFHPSGEHLALGLWSGFVHVVRITDGVHTETQDVPVHNGRVNDLTFQRDGRRMFTAGDDGIVQLWDIDWCNPT